MLQITQTPFGTLDSAPVSLYTLSRASGIRVRVCDYGGIIQSVLVPQPDGAMREVVLGYDTLDEYVRDALSFGATIGPIADVVTDGRFTLDGQPVQWEKNLGSDCIHSGSRGFHRQLFTAVAMPEALMLRRRFPAAFYGYPGELDVRILFSLPDEQTLQIDYAVTSPAAFAASVTNHSYFRLSDAPTVENQLLCLQSGTRQPLDFSAPRRLGEALGSNQPGIQKTGGIDHYYPIRGAGLRMAAQLYAPDTQLLLTCRTDAPGVLVYTANSVFDARGRGGAVYSRHSAVCLEAEAIPNAVNLPQHSQAVFPGGHFHKSCTQFSFSNTADFPAQGD